MILVCGGTSHHSSSDLLFQGLEFIQFLQQDYLPGLQVSPEIAQVKGRRQANMLTASASL